MPISYSPEKKIFSLHTDRSTYQLAVDGTCITARAARERRNIC